MRNPLYCGTITSQAIPPSPPHCHQLGQVSHSPGANLVGHVGHEQCVEHLGGGRWGERGLRPEDGFVLPIRPSIKDMAYC